MPWRNDLPPIGAPVAVETARPGGDGSPNRRRRVEPRRPAAATQRINGDSPCQVPDRLREWTRRAAIPDPDHCDTSCLSNQTERPYRAENWRGCSVENQSNGLEEMRAGLDRPAATRAADTPLAGKGSPPGGDRVDQSMKWWCWSPHARRWMPSGPPEGAVDDTHWCLSATPPTTPVTLPWPDLPGGQGETIGPPRLSEAPPSFSA